MLIKVYGFTFESNRKAVRLRSFLVLGIKLFSSNCREKNRKNPCGVFPEFSSKV
jgi:hypothetical protein